MNKILASLIAGIAIGLLIAPAKGSETWKRIVDDVDDYLGNATDKAEDVYESGRKLLKNGKSKIERGAEQMEG
jgi:gas vesicle protein